jgi:hypothetical protein
MSITLRLLPVVFLVILMGCGQTEPRAVSEKRSIDYSQTKKAQAAKTTSVARIGAEAILDNDAENVLVAVDKKSFYEMKQKFLSGDNRLEVMMMALKGHLIMVPCGVRIRILDKDSYATKIYILEGEYSGRTGWILCEFAKPISP